MWAGLGLGWGCGSFGDSFLSVCRAWGEALGVWAGVSYGPFGVALLGLVGGVLVVFFFVLFFFSGLGVLSCLLCWWPESLFFISGLSLRSPSSATILVPYCGANYGLLC